jgi:hypothetical protein
MTAITGRVIIMTEIITAIPTSISDSLGVMAALIATGSTTMMTMGITTGQWHRMAAIMAARAPASVAQAFIPPALVDSTAPQYRWADLVAVDFTAVDSVVADSTAAAMAVVAGTVNRSDYFLASPR